MPIDTSIYGNLLQRKSVGDFTAELQAQDLREQGRQQNALMLQQGRQKQDEYGRSVRDQDTIRSALGQLPPGATDDQRINALRGTGLPQGYTQADALQTTLTNRDKGAAEIAAKRAEAASKNGALFKQYAGILVQDPTAETAMSLVDHFERQTGERADNIRAIIQRAGNNPDMLRRIGAALSVEAEKLLPRSEVRNLGGTDQAMSTDFLGNVTPGQSFAKTATPGEKLQAGTAGARLAFDREKERNDSTLARDRLEFDRTKPAAGGNPRTGPMSVTLQKELLESDDAVQSAAAVVRSLQSAKTQNSAAYSGYLAKPRATLASNVIPGGTAAADAAIDIDNLMTGQGLEQMKAIFGAAPTEGERKILLDMQASVDKTPKQREAIMDRAIAAAQRRAEYATKKAKSIRDGSYLTEGIPQGGAPAAKTVVRTGTSNGRKVVEYSDGSITYAD